MTLDPILSYLERGSQGLRQSDGIAAEGVVRAVSRSEDGNTYLCDVEVRALGGRRVLIPDCGSAVPLHVGDRVHLIIPAANVRRGPYVEGLLPAGGVYYDEMTPQPVASQAGAVSAAPFAWSAVALGSAPLRRSHGHRAFILSVAATLSFGLDYNAVDIPVYAEPLTESVTVTGAHGHSGSWDWDGTEHVGNWRWPESLPFGAETWQARLRLAFIPEGGGPGVQVWSDNFPAVWRHGPPNKLGPRLFRVSYDAAFRHQALLRFNDLDLEDEMRAELSLQPVVDLRTAPVAAVRPFTAADISIVLAELGAGTDQR